MAVDDGVFSAAEEIQFDPGVHVEPVPEGATGDGIEIATETGASGPVVAGAIAETSGADDPAAGGGDPHVEEPTIDELIAATAIGPTGDVSCGLAPFSAMRRVGRVSTWPDHKPEFERSASVLCNIHSGRGVKCQVAKVRRLCDDKKALTWLYSVRSFPFRDAMTADERHSTAKDHMAVFKGMHA